MLYPWTLGGFAGQPFLIFQQDEWGLPGVNPCPERAFAGGRVEEGAALAVAPVLEIVANRLPWRRSTCCPAQYILAFILPT